jgi:2-polyprenyl-3-methyl-5-hydroxy-6-metoxy-1,4-benzoquinol methylase
MLKSLKAFAKKNLREEQVKRLRLYFFPVFRLLESFVFGGGMRRNLLIFLLRHYYESQSRRHWIWYSEVPHFSNNEATWFSFTYSPRMLGFHSFYRAFFSSEVVRPGDHVLDIGCGDGFFTRRFLAPNSARVDAIDIEPSAIAIARRYNSGPVITYQVKSAVTEDIAALNNGGYDVIVWDGGIGHFAPQTTEKMLEKISAALAPDGIFVGSESLGLEGKDHLHFFYSAEEVARIFRPFFQHIYMRTVNYGICDGSLPREEVYWRCTNNPARIEQNAWRRMASMS